MIVPAVVGDGSGTETAVDRYRWHRELPATMARQRAEMQSQVTLEQQAIREEDEAHDEYEAWVAERGLDGGFEPMNPTAYKRYLLRESIDAGYEEDRAAAQKRLDELRAARQAQRQITPVEEEPEGTIELELPHEDLSPLPARLRDGSQYRGDHNGIG